MKQPYILQGEDWSGSRTEAFLENSGFPGMKKFARASYAQIGEKLPPHIHENSIEICYHTRGTQIYHADGKVYKSHGGMIFLTYPNEEHDSFGMPQEKDTTLYYWIIDTVSDKEHFLGLPKDDAVSLAEAVQGLPRFFHVSKEIEELYEHAYKVITQPSERQETKIRCALFTLLNEIVEQANNSTDGGISINTFPICRTIEARRME